MKIEKYCINEDGIKGFVKSAGIWAINGNRHFPLVYLKKPKYLSDEKFKEIIRTIEIKIEKDFEI